MGWIVSNRYIEIETPESVITDCHFWLDEHDREVSCLNDIRDIFSETRYGAMRDWMNSHPDLYKSETFSYEMWRYFNRHVIQCNTSADPGPRRFLWWFSPKDRELAMIFKLVWGGT